MTPDPEVFGIGALAACRTGVDFYVPAILLQIERLSLLKIIAAIADDRWRKFSGYQAAIQASIESAQPRLSACAAPLVSCTECGIMRGGILAR